MLSLHPTLPSSLMVIFIGPRSDHCLTSSVTQCIIMSITLYFASQVVVCTIFANFVTMVCQSCYVGLSKLVLMIYRTIDNIFWSINIERTGLVVHSVHNVQCAARRCLALEDFQCSLIALSVPLKIFIWRVQVQFVRKMIRNTKKDGEL